MIYYQKDENIIGFLIDKETCEEIDRWVQKYNYPITLYLLETVKNLPSDGGSYEYDLLFQENNKCILTVNNSALLD